MNDTDQRRGAAVGFGTAARGTSFGTATAAAAGATATMEPTSSSRAANFMASIRPQNSEPTTGGGFENVGFDDDQREKRKRTGPRAKYIPAEATDERVNRADIQAGSRYDEVTANVSVEVHGGDGQHDLRMESFEHRHVLPQLQQNIKLKGWDKPTPVQSATIPLILTNQHDMIVNAPTGQGKSAAFLIPLIQMISFRKRKQKVQDGVINQDAPYAIVFLSTRDLALQICNQARQLAKGVDNVKVAWAFGQTDMNEQRKVLKEGCDILCVTEGRFVMLLDQKQVKPNEVRYFVIDEADKLLSDYDQMPKVRDRVKKKLPVDTKTGKPLFQTLMFSATFTAEATQIAEENFLQPGYFVVRTGKINQVVDTVKQEVFEVSRWEKRHKLLELLNEWATGKSSDSEGEITLVEKTLVFVQVKRQADVLANFLSLRGFKATPVHGYRRQQQREEALEKFREGVYEVLVASDIAARGLNLGVVEHVVVFDMHGNDLQLVHRLGRTGRMGNEGHAVIFFDPYEESNKTLAAGLVESMDANGDPVPDFLSGYRAVAAAASDADVPGFDDFSLADGPNAEAQ